MKTQAQDIIAHTMDFWSQRAGHQFSQEDARQAVDNVCGFFAILNEWQRRAHEGDGGNE